MHQIDKIKLILKENTGLPKIIALILMASVIDVIGLTVIVPYVTYRIDPTGENIIRTLLKFIDVDQVETGLELIILTLLLLRFFAQKEILGKINLFCYRAGSKIKRELVKATLEEDYSKFQNDINGKILAENQKYAEDFSQGVLLSILLLVNNIVIVTIFLILGIYAYGGIVIIPLILITIIAGLGTLLTAGYMQKKGIIANDSIAQQAETINEIINGYKSIRANGEDKHFIKKYIKRIEVYAETVSDVVTIKALPKYIFEFSILINILIFLTFSENFGSISQNELVAIGTGMLIFLMRVTPLFSSSLSSIITLNYSKNTIDEIYKRIKNGNRYKSISTVYKEKIKENSTKKIAIEIKDATYVLGKKKILENVSLKVHEGEWIALKGDSGSGKTTFLDILSGLIKINSGVIEYSRKIYEKRYYIPQHIPIYQGNLKENIVMGLDFNKLNYNKVVHITDLKTKFSQELSVNNQLEKKISGGQRQRVGIARAIYREPKLLIMDESLSALDNKSSNLIFSRLKNEHKCGVICVLHTDEFDHMFDRIVKLEDGCLVQK